MSDTYNDIYNEILGENKLKTYYKFSDFEYNVKGKERILSNIAQLDYMIKGFELGCVTIWTGVTNMGKSTVLTKIAKESLLQNEKVFFFNGEQTKDDFKNNLYKQFAPRDKIYKKQYKNTNICDYYVEDFYSRYLSGLYDNKIFVYNNDVVKTIDMLIGAMTECLKQGVRVFIIDNFMQIDIPSENIFQEQTRIAESLRTFAVNNNVHVHLVAHPKKIEDRQIRLSLYDISGSMNLVNKAYNVISIIRVDRLDDESREYESLKKAMLDNRYDINETSTILEVLKEKGNGCGVVGLKYDTLQRTFTEQNKMEENKYNAIMKLKQEEKQLAELEKIEKRNKKLEKYKNKE